MENHLDKLLPHPRSLEAVVHHAAMTYDAVPALSGTDRHRHVPELCLAFAILTAARSQEARGARWDEFDFKAKHLDRAAERMKRSASIACRCRPRRWR